MNFEKGKTGEYLKTTHPRNKITCGKIWKKVFALRFNNTEYCRYLVTGTLHMRWLTVCEGLPKQRKMWCCVGLQNVCKRKRKVYPKILHPEVCDGTGLCHLTWPMHKPLPLPNPLKTQIDSAVSEISDSEDTVHPQSDVFIPLHILQHHWAGWMIKRTAFIK